MLYIKKSLADVKREMEKDAEHYSALSAAWAAVKINKKKNGEEFALIAKAVDGARVNNKPYWPDEKEITVYTSTSLEGYIYDSLDLFVYADELPADDPRAQGLKKSFIRAKVPATAEEIRNRIKNHIADLNKWEAEKREALLTIEEDYKEYIAAVEAANAVQKKHGEMSATYYALYGVVA